MRCPRLDKVCYHGTGVRERGGVRKHLKCSGVGNGSTAEWRVTPPTGLSQRGLAALVGDARRAVSRTACAKVRGLPRHDSRLKRFLADKPALPHLEHHMCSRYQQCAEDSIREPPLYRHKQPLTRESLGSLILPVIPWPLRQDDRWFRVGGSRCDVFRPLVLLGWPYPDHREGKRCT